MVNLLRNTQESVRRCDFVVSPEFRAAVRASGRSAKDLAKQVRVPAFTFWKILSGDIGVRLGDPRIMAVCEILEFNPGLAFEIRFPEEGVSDGEG